MQVSALASGLSGMMAATEREGSAAAQIAGGDLSAETLVDALVVQPSLYAANARVVDAGARMSGALVDLYAW
jgi:hypothetical protein